MCSPGSLAVSADTKPLQPLQALTGRSPRATGHLVTEEHLRRGSQHHRGESTEDRAHARQGPPPPRSACPGPSATCVCKVPPGPLGHTLLTQGYGTHPTQPVAEQSHQLRASASRMSHTQTHPARYPHASQLAPPQGICSGEQRQPLPLMREGGGLGSGGRVRGTPGRS